MPIFRKEQLDIDAPAEQITMLWHQRTGRVIAFTKSDSETLPLTPDDLRLISSGRWTRIKRTVTVLEWAILQHGSAKLVGDVITDASGMISDGR